MDSWAPAAITGGCTLAGVLITLYVTGARGLRKWVEEKLETLETRLNTKIDEIDVTDEFQFLRGKMEGRSEAEDQARAKKLIRDLEKMGGGAE